MPFANEILPVAEKKELSADARSLSVHWAGVWDGKASVHNLNKSNFSNGLIFGDSISNSFKGKKSYFHDALYGAFEYNFDSHLISEKPKRISNLENSFDENKFESFSAELNNSEKKSNYSFVVDKNNYLVPEEGISYSVSGNNHNLNTC